MADIEKVNSAPEYHVDDDKPDITAAAHVEHLTAQALDTNTKFQVIQIDAVEAEEFELSLTNLQAIKLYKRVSTDPWRHSDILGDLLGFHRLAFDHHGRLRYLVHGKLHCSTSVPRILWHFLSINQRVADPNQVDVGAGSGWDPWQFHWNRESKWGFHTCLTPFSHSGASSSIALAIAKHSWATMS